MSKVLNALNQIWYVKDGEDIKMGLTRSFLDTLDECWHIIPTGGARIREKAPLFTVETNDSLVSVLSPVSGNFLNWNDRATNFPDKLSEDDVIIQLTTRVIPPPAEDSREFMLAEIARLEGIVGDSDQRTHVRLNAQTQQQALQRRMIDLYGPVDTRAGFQRRPAAAASRGTTTFFAEMETAVGPPMPRPSIAQTETRTASWGTFTAVTDDPVIRGR